MDSEKSGKKPWSQPKLDNYGSLPEIAKGREEGPQLLPKKKKKYSKPELVVYGKLEEITGNVALGTGAVDNFVTLFKTR